MPITVKWKPEARLIIWDIQGRWTFEEFHAAQHEGEVLLAGVDYPFDLVVNANNNPPPEFPLTEFKKAMSNAHPLLNLTIFVQSSAFAKVILGVLQKLNIPNTGEQKMFFVESWEEVGKIVAEKRGEAAFDIHTAIA